MVPVRLGDVPTGDPTPERYITIEDDGTPQVRIDLYYDGSRHPQSFAFEDAIIWGEWLVIGFGEQVFLVRLRDQQTSTIDLGSYFGHLYPFASCLLAASAERLFGVRGDGKLAWTTDILGIDGVIVQRVVGNAIEGEGEWNPPGDWRPFRVDIGTGKLLA